MNRLLFWIAAAMASCTPTLYNYADPGSGLPLFRRQSRSATPDAPRKPDPAQETAPAIVAAGITSEQSAGAEVDVAEVIRRGDRAVAAGRGPMSVADTLIGDATAPPPDDSHKWFFSVIVDDSKESQALLYDLKHSEYLRAWINLDEPKQSWSHTTVYVAKDQTQDWRWSKLTITRYPVLILQPPAKLRDEKKTDSWEWGHPSTVVWQWDGYDATSPNRAQLRSDAIRKSLTLYVQRVAARQRSDALLAGPRKKDAPPPTPGAKQEPTPGAKQDHGANPPFTFPSTPAAPAANPVFPTDPTYPSGPLAPTGGAISQIGGLIQTGLGSGGFWVFVLVALKAFELFAARTSGKTDDAIAAIARSIVSEIRSPNPTTTNPPTT